MILQLSSVTPTTHIFIVKEGAIVLSTGCEWKRNQKEVCVFKTDEERPKMTKTLSKFQRRARCCLVCFFVQQRNAA